MSLRYLHTMVRVANIEQSLDFYCNKLGMQEVRRVESEAGRYTLIFLAAPDGQGQGRGRSGAAAGADLQLGPREIRRGAQFRPSGLRGRRHLRHVRSADEGRCHHQPPAARRAHGLCPLARQRLASSCCRRARRRPSKSRGHRCPTPASGDGVPDGSRRCRRSSTNFLKIDPAEDRLLKPRRLYRARAGRCARARCGGCCRGGEQVGGAASKPADSQAGRRFSPVAHWPVRPHARGPEECRMGPRCGMR